MGDQFDRMAETFPDRDAFVHVDRNVRYTYREIQTIANRFSKGLLSLGVGRGEHLALWATSIPEWIIVQLASAKIGATLVPFNPQYRECWWPRGQGVPLFGCQNPHSSRKG